MRLFFRTIPHETHRYPTVGDYWMDDEGDMQFRVSQMSNRDYEALVFLHEFIEWYLTDKRGITEESISEFDVNFERERAEGLHSASEEPGHNKNAPYRREHKFAEKLERKFAKELGINWKEYDKYISEL